MHEQEVTIPSESVTLAGTLVGDGDQGRGPAVLLIPGSGPVDRNSDAKRLPLGITRHLANHLTDHGVTSLRFDKRGVGASKAEGRAGFYDNVADARTALDFLAQQPGVVPERVFIVGHSEGALIAIELAGSGAPTAGVVLLSGAAQTGEEVLRWQNRKIAPLLPAPVRLLIKVLRIDPAKSQTKQLDRLKQSTDDEIRVQLAKVNAKWFREFIDYDPAPAFRSAQVPILAITGTNDVQVDPDDIALMDQLTDAPFEGHVVPGVNHILRSAGPSPTAYKKQVGLPLDAGVLDLITNWLDRQRAAAASHEADRAGG